MTTTPFQQAGLDLSEHSLDFSMVWGSRNLPQTDPVRARASRRACHAYMDYGDAIAALTEHGFTVSAPRRVVAVVNAKAVRGFPYLVAAIYELAPRADGTLTYRKGTTARPRRSERLAVADAEEMAGRLGVPFWPLVRHHMSADEAIRLHEGS